MAGTLGVRFAKAGKIEYFNAGDETFELNEYIVARTPHGADLGWVVITPQQVLMAKTKAPLPRIARRATPDDVADRDRLKAKGSELIAECKTVARELNLAMKLVEANFALDGTQVDITYTSEDQVDFQSLLSRLSDTVDAKINMRQIGPRDEAKVVDGLGRCGLTLCCSTWLTEFQPVTMKMAKEQNLPLSPPGLAGQCGRLRCCLRYEYEQYRELKRGLPKIGSRVGTPHGGAVVVVGHPLKQTITVRVEESGVWTEVAMDEIGEAPPERPPQEAETRQRPAPRSGRPSGQSGPTAERPANRFVRQQAEGQQADRQQEAPGRSSNDRSTRGRRGPRNRPDAQRQ